MLIWFYTGKKTQYGVVLICFPWIHVKGSSLGDLNLAGLRLGSYRNSILSLGADFGVAMLPSNLLFWLYDWEHDGITSWIWAAGCIIRQHTHWALAVFFSHKTVGTFRCNLVIFLDMAWWRVCFETWGFPRSGWTWNCFLGGFDPRPIIQSHIPKYMGKKQRSGTFLKLENKNNLTVSILKQVFQKQNARGFRSHHSYLR